MNEEVEKQMTKGALVGYITKQAGPAVVQFFSWIGQSIANAVGFCIAFLLVFF